MKIFYQIEEYFYFTLGVLCIAFGLLDWCTTKVIDPYTATFQSLKDTAINGYMHAGALMMGTLLMFLWFIAKEDNK